MTFPLIIYHHACADGLGAAWAAHRALPDAELFSASYGQAPPSDEQLAGRDVFAVDFSYPREQLERMAKVARSVLVLDHHDTARQALEGLPEFLDGRSVNLAAQFDMNRSGAGITWDFFHDVPRPRIIDLIEDRDLWRFRYGDESRALHAQLVSYGITDRETAFVNLEKWDFYFKEVDILWHAMIDGGLDLLRYQAQLVRGIVDSTMRPMRIGDHEVPSANASTLISEVGHELIERNPEAPFVAVWYDDDSGMRRYSLRGSPGKVHCGEVARRFDGGGHPGAAGFSLKPGEIL